MVKCNELSEDNTNRPQIPICVPTLSPEDLQFLAQRPSALQEYQRMQDELLQLRIIYKQKLDTIEHLTRLGDQLQEWLTVLEKIHGKK